MRLNTTEESEDEHFIRRKSLLKDELDTHSEATQHGSAHFDSQRIQNFLLTQRPLGENQMRQASQTFNYSDAHTKMVFGIRKQTFQDVVGSVLDPSRNESKDFSSR